MQEVHGQEGALLDSLYVRWDNIRQIYPESRVALNGHIGGGAGY